MDVLAFLGEVGRLALPVFIVIAPLLAWQWIALWARPYRRRPDGLTDPTIIAGMMVGIGMLAVILRPETLSWGAIVSVGGFWDLSVGEFAELARSMMIHGPGALFAALQFDDERRDLEAWLVLAIVLWWIRMIAVWLTGPPRGTVRFLAAELVTFLASAFGTVYLGPLLFWSINRLNFWLILIAILLIQDYRYDDPPLFGRLVGGTRLNRHAPPRPGSGPEMAMPVPDPD